MKISKVMSNLLQTGLLTGPYFSYTGIQRWVFHEIVAQLGEAEVESINTSRLDNTIYKMKQHYALFHGKKSLDRHQQELQNALASFFQWASVELAINHTEEASREEDRAGEGVTLPKPFSIDEVQAMLEFGSSAQDPDEIKARNRALILLLLDTGLWVDELCRIKVGDLDLEKASVQILTTPGSREVYLGKKCREALQQYLSFRSGSDAEERLFISEKGNPLTREQVIAWLNQLGELAAVKDITPLRFRRTFAVWYLQSGGSFTDVKLLLGFPNMLEVAKHLGWVPG